MNDKDRHEAKDNEDESGLEQARTWIEQLRHRKLETKRVHVDYLDRRRGRWLPSLDDTVDE